MRLLLFTRSLNYPKKVFLFLLLPIVLPIYTQELSIYESEKLIKEEIHAREPRLESENEALLFIPKNSPQTLIIWHLIITTETNIELALSLIQKILDQNSIKTPPIQNAIFITSQNKQLSPSERLRLSPLFTSSQTISVEIPLKAQTKINFLSGSKKTITPEWVIQEWVDYTKKNSSQDIILPPSSNYFMRLHIWQESYFRQLLNTENIYTHYGLSGLPVSLDQSWFDYLNDFHTQLALHFSTSENTVYSFVGLSSFLFIVNQTYFFYLIIILFFSSFFFILIFWRRFIRRQHLLSKQLLPLIIFIGIIIYINYLTHTSYLFLVKNFTPTSYLSYSFSLQSLLIFLFLININRIHLIPYKRFYYSYTAMNVGIITLLFLLFYDISIAFPYFIFFLLILGYTNSKKKFLQIIFLVLYAFFIILVAYSSLYSLFFSPKYLSQFSIQIPLIFSACLIPFFLLLLGLIKSYSHAQKYSSQRNTNIFFLAFALLVFIFSLYNV